MLKVNFVMTWIIYKVLMLLKITRILKCFLRSIIDLYFLKKNSFFLQHIMKKYPRPEEENIIKDDLFRLEKLKKERIDTTIKDIRNLSRLER